MKFYKIIELGITACHLVFLSSSTSSSALKFWNNAMEC